MDKSKEVISDNLLLWVNPLVQILGSWRVGVEVYLEPSGTLLPLAQNNPHTTEVGVGMTRSDPCSLMLLLSDDRLLTLYLGGPGRTAAH